MRCAMTWRARDNRSVLPRLAASAAAWSAAGWSAAGGTAAGRTGAGWTGAGGTGGAGTGAGAPNSALGRPTRAGPGGSLRYLRGRRPLRRRGRLRWRWRRLGYVSRRESWSLVAALGPRCLEHVLLRSE